MPSSVDNTPGPNGLPNRALHHHPQRAISFLVKIFNAFVRSRHFAPIWKRARVISILKPGNDLAQPSSFQPTSLLDTVDKSEEILLARILSEVSEHELLRDEQFGFGPKHSMPLQLARLVESDKGLGENWLTGAVFLDVAQALDIWIEGLLFILTILNLPSYPVRNIPSCLQGRTFEASFQTSTSSHHGMLVAVAQGGFISHVLRSLYVNMLSPSHHVELVSLTRTTRPS